MYAEQIGRLLMGKTAGYMSDAEFASEFTKLAARMPVGGNARGYNQRQAKRRGMKPQTQTQTPTQPQPRQDILFTDEANRRLGNAAFGPGGVFSQGGWVSKHPVLAAGGAMIAANTLLPRRSEPRYY